MTRHRLTVQTDSGPVILTEEDGAIVAVTWHRPGRSAAPPQEPGTTPLLHDAAQQLRDYFAGARRQFDLPLKPRGSEFHRAVWREMLAIPYGQTKSYGDLAKATGSIARAVGTACGANPIPIFIPCHRVLAADRQLGGFSGGEGPETKAFLLTLEGAWPVQHALPL
ncbi:methylated-DNA--[protein]-cysteine S-methyltransferase [Pelagibius sp. CAU 1746]|uniref:methylated-DNA--[protein]-cysteine S-methyltransferase n=1 Tax=Pelagibius sp. CAU 1746 TaxID=3140370 RepID=UPI00325AB9DD